MFFNVHGKIEIIDQKSASEIKVQLWDKDLLSDDMLGEAIVDNDGKFSILASMTETGESSPELYVKIFSSGKLITTTKPNEVSGLLSRNEITGFVEQSSYDIGIITI
jgi:hypothetical protein